MRASHVGWLIYVPFILGTVYCYGEYLLVRYYPSKDLTLDINHQPSNEICSKACANVKAQMCQEWTTIKSSLCPDVCDSYLEADVQYGNWKDIFQCVEGAESPQEIQNCGVTCTGPTEL